MMNPFRHLDVNPPPTTKTKNNNKKIAKQITNICGGACPGYLDAAGQFSLNYA